MARQTIGVTFGLVVALLNLALATSCEWGDDAEEHAPLADFTTLSETVQQSQARQTQAEQHQQATEQRTVQVEQRVVAMERQIGTLSQSLTSLTQQNAVLRQELTQTRMELAQTQEQVRVMQAQAGRARRAIRDYRGNR